jgi:hypothetical protein
MAATWASSNDHSPELLVMGLAPMLFTKPDQSFGLRPSSICYTLSTASYSLHNVHHTMRYALAAPKVLELETRHCSSGLSAHSPDRHCLAD